MASGTVALLADGAWETVLTDEEHVRRASLNNEARRTLFTLGRLVLRRHLGERLGMDPRDVPIRILESGRLVLDAGAPGVADSSSTSSLVISLAHSGDRALAVSGARPLGVDLEIMKPRKESLLKYITHEDERPVLGALAPTAHEQLYAVWTLKEAVLKGIGTGLRTGPRRLRITPGGLAPPATSADSGAVTGPEWRRATVLDTDERTWNACFQVADGYATAIAW
ncbi:MAG: 4'-phosphopantetheinyl transferase superfamily protein [Rhodothermales bacterium]